MENAIGSDVRDRIETLANVHLDYARKLVDLVERMAEAQEDAPDDQAIDQFHELLVELGVLGAIGNVGLNIVCGEMSQIHAKLFERAISSKVQERTQAIFTEFEERLGGIELSSPAAASANETVPTSGPFTWLRLTEKYADANPDLDTHSHAFLGRGEDLSVLSVCGRSRGPIEHWDRQEGNVVTNPCESCVRETVR